MALLPVLIAIVSLSGRTWIPTGDEASILYRTRQVGSEDTPLTGVYAQRGWAHPGPLLYYLLAPFHRLLGSAPISILQAAGMLNLASVSIAAYLAFRRRGAWGVLVVTCFLTVLLIGIRPALVVHPWNPYVPMIAYFAFLVATWSVAEKDWKVLPLTLALGSAIVQMHVGYTPLVIAAAATAAVLLLLDHLRSKERGRAYGRSIEWSKVVWRLRVSLLVVLVLWLPPLIDQLIGNGNLTEIVDYFANSEAESVHFDDGLGILSSHLRIGGPWMGGREYFGFGGLRPGSTWPLFVVLCLLMAASVLTLRLARGSHPLPVIALSQVVAAMFATSRVELPLLSYLIVWMMPLATFAWFSIALTFGGVVDHFWRAPGGVSAARPRLASLAIGASVLTLPVLSALASRSATRPVLPRQENASAVSSVLEQLDEKLDSRRSLRIEGAGDIFNEAWVGVVYGLAAHDFDFFTSDGGKGEKWGADRVWSGQSVDDVLTVVSARPTEYEDLVNTCDADEELERIAVWDLLTAQQRQRMKDLQLELFVQDGNLSLADAQELEELTAAGFRMVVFSGDHVCSVI